MAMSGKIYMTPEGITELKQELEHLTTIGRRDVAHKLGTAADDGDLSENAAYDQAKEDQGKLEGRILEITEILRRAVPLQEATRGRDSSQVGIGSKVTVKEVSDEDEEHETYVIVSPVEAAPRQGRISHESPVGRALLNRMVGDQVPVTTPAGDRLLTIISIG